MYRPSPRYDTGNNATDKSETSNSPVFYEYHVMISEYNDSLSFPYNV